MKEGKENGKIVFPEKDKMIGILKGVYVEEGVTERLYHLMTVDVAGGRVSIEMVGYVLFYGMREFLDECGYEQIEKEKILKRMPDYIQAFVSKPRALEAALRSFKKEIRAYEQRCGGF